MGRAAALAAAQGAQVAEPGLEKPGSGTEGPIKVAMGQRGLSKWLWDRGANQSGYGPSICVLCCHMGLVSGVVDRISKQPKNDLSALG